MKRIIVTITGDADYNNYSELAIFCDKVLEGYDKVTIKTGNQGNTETNAQIYAVNRGFKLEIIETEYPDLPRDKFDRQIELLDCSNKLIVFWNGINAETKEIIDRAFWSNIDVKVLGNI